MQPVTRTKIYVGKNILKRKNSFPICLPDVQVIGQDHLEDKLFSVVGYASENASTIDLKELKVRDTKYCDV